MGYRMLSRKEAWARLNFDTRFGHEVVRLALALHSRSQIQIPIVTDTFESIRITLHLDNHTGILRLIRSRVTECSLGLGVSPQLVMVCSGLHVACLAISSVIGTRKICPYWKATNQSFETTSKDRQHREGSSSFKIVAPWDPTLPPTATTSNACANMIGNDRSDLLIAAGTYPLELHRKVY